MCSGEYPGRTIDKGVAAMSGFNLALCSMFFMGVSNYLYKRSTDSIGPTNTTFYYYLFSAVIAVFVWLAYREESIPSLSQLVWPFAVAISLFLSVWTFNLALGSLDVSIASMIRGLFFVVTFALAVFLSGETLTPRKLMATALAVIAVLVYGTGGKS